MQSCLNDLNWHAEIRIHVDASATRSMATRQGIGRVMHLQVWSGTIGIGSHLAQAR